MEGEVTASNNVPLLQGDLPLKEEIRNLAEESCSFAYETVDQQQECSTFVQEYTTDQLGAETVEVMHTLGTVYYNEGCYDEFGMLNPNGLYDGYCSHYLTYDY